MSNLLSQLSDGLDDLRHLSGRLDEDVLRQCLMTTGARLAREAELHDAAEVNGYVLYGEALPGAL
jgi:hypothetical protein